jgi:Nucleotide modification associated domain 2
MTNVYVYAVSYDLGFAPNPFGGLCSLACCKPKVREKAVIGDWIIGLTGVKIAPAMRCVFAMVVTRGITFDDYWGKPEFATRRPVQNGTQKKHVGDNIYHRDTPASPWHQEDSVHSQVDGTQCLLNTSHDTRINRVLLSDKFVYFGASAPPVPQPVCKALEYSRNSRDYRRFDAVRAKPILDWLAPQIAAHPNQVLEDPINFASSAMRFSPTLQRMV